MGVRNRCIYFYYADPGCKLGREHRGPEGRGEQWYNHHSSASHNSWEY